MAGEAVAGRRVLVVEDDYLLSMGMAAILERAGARVVGPASNVREALEALGERPDCATLDVQLGKETSFPIADELTSRDIPFLFCTGTARDIPPIHRSRIVCPKPYTARGILDALAIILAA